MKSLKVEGALREAAVFWVLLYLSVSQFWSYSELSETHTVTHIASP